jgi:chromosome segregation ATPase
VQAAVQAPVQVQTRAEPAARREPAPQPVAVQPVAVQPPVLDTRERREKLRERLKAATAKVEPTAPTPQSPAEARTSALSLIAQLRQELEDVKQLNAAMVKDLDQTRTDLGRAAEEARNRTAEAARMATEVAERARLIEELGKEMSALEAERDDTLIELQGARALVGTEATARRDLEEKLAAREAELAETLTEEERLAGELEARNGELRQAQSALSSVVEERDRLARQVAELTRERADLLDSQKALDEIHRALADARARVSPRG